MGDRSKPLVRRVRVAALGLVALTLALGACSRSSYEYVSSSDRKAYFKIPANWEFYDKRDLLVASGQSLSTATNDQFPWLIGYDSSPDPSVKHVIDIGDPTSYPVVMAQVEQLPNQVRDQFSINSLRNWVYPVDRLIQANAGEMVSYDDNLVVEGGLHGLRMTFDVTLGGNSSVIAGNKVIRATQTAYVDPKTNRLYLFLIRCESHCYRDNKALIDQITNSWTVKER
jgi:hypothetical protein